MFLPRCPPSIASTVLGMCYTSVALYFRAHGCCAVECGVACCAAQHGAIATFTEYLSLQSLDNHLVEA